MHKDAEDFIKRCVTCQLNNYNTHPFKGKRFLLVASRPFERVTIDAIGKLEGDDSYSYIVVFICNMSRFVRLYVVKSLKARLFLPILEQYVLQFQPENLFYHNHGQFNNSGVDKLAKAFGIPIGNPAAYSHEENGMVEAANKTVRRHFLKWFAPNPREPWHSYLPYVERIMCDSRVPGLDHTPNDIVLGRSFARRARLNISADEYVKELSEHTQAILGCHQRHLKVRQDIVAKENALKNDVVLDPGMLVLITNPTRTKQINSAGMPNTGPFTVLKQDGNTVSIADRSRSGLVRQVHISRVKIFVPPADYRPDQSVNADFYQVEKITGHRFTKKNNLKVTFKWQDSDELTEETLSSNPSIRRTLAFHAYCQEHKDLLHYTHNIVTL
jgi:hypothetical protein